MKKSSVLWPDPLELIPRVPQTYVDVDGVLENALKLTLPTAWVNEEPDAPPSSNILFNSMHGLGKSLMAATMAVRASEILGKSIPAITLDCHEDIRDHHLRGSFSEQEDGTLVFVPGPFPAAIHMANEVGCCFLLVEEVSALTPGSQKMFNAMTDWRQGIYIPQIGQFINLLPGRRVIIIATMNPSAYGGVYTLNDDLRSRFDEYEIQIPSMANEMRILKTVCPYAPGGLIEKVCQVAKETRTDETEYKLSTRDLQHFVENWHKLGGDFATDALGNAVPNDGGKIALALIANKFEGEDRRFIIDRVKAVFNHWVEKKK